MPSIRKLSFPAPKLHAYYRGNEIEADFISDCESTDYGVPGSPVFLEPVNLEITRLEICSVTLDPDSLPDPVRAAIMELASELEWETLY